MSHSSSTINGRCVLWVGVALGISAVLTLAWLDPNGSYFQSVYTSNTNFVSEVLVTNGITLGGVRNTTWPASSVIAQSLSPSPTILPASNSALLDTGGSGYQFLFAANANATWQFQIPQGWTGTLKFRGMYGMDTATSGTCILEADVWAMNDSDARAFTNPNFGSANLITNTVPGTIYFPQAFSITCANVGGTLQAGSWVQVKLTRTGTATGNMALQSVAFSN